MDELVKISEDKPCPYAESVDNLYNLLAKAIKGWTGFKYVYALRKNIAYNLQYLEFLDRCMTDLKMSDVIRKLNYKVFIMVGISIMEALLHYLLVKNNHYPETNWELELIAKGNEKRIGNKIIKVDSHIYKKLPSPVPKDTSFNKMLDIAEKRKILGGNPNLYPRLNYLRKLRNKVHLYLIDSNLDHDLNKFNLNDMSAMAQVIHSAFTSGIFRPSNREKAYFEYLKNYFEEEERELLEPEGVKEIKYEPEKLE